jgi:sigma-E factor negative regulatory protein RseB
VPGFDTQQVVRRPMAPWSHRATASASAGTDATMVQAVYSDGLTHVSVFIEPFVATLHKRETPATVGSTSALSRRQGDWWITAVGAVPVTTLQQFIGGLDRRRP